MKKKRRRQYVPVSKLADYAANAEKFRQTRGRTQDTQAAKEGKRTHKNTTTAPTMWYWRIAALLFVIAVVVVAYLQPALFR